MTERESTPPDLREGVRSGILASIKQDVERRGGRTARLLLAAGGVGVVGAVGIVLLISGHPFGHHPGWHVAVFSAVWAGLLVVSFAAIFLGIRTPRFALSRAAMVGILGLGIAGACGAICPDQHFLRWWSSTSAGAALEEAMGSALSTLCFGFVATASIGFAAAWLVAGPARTAMDRLLPAAALSALLAPGVALQSVGHAWPVFVSWMLGTAIGAITGVYMGSRSRGIWPPI